MMTTFVLPHGKESLSRHLETLPKDGQWRVEVKPHKAKRSTEQNHLQHKWINEAADQLKDHTAEEYRAFCKLHFGVPILRAEDDEFRDAYDRIIRPHSYEDKLEMMKAPLDFPVTRLMTVKQKSQYLDAMYQHFRGLGVQLTEPAQ